ncbi:MAG TPA: hypothetical protein VH639_15865 [Bryobacteraceae bacterium]|jgi:hypothetical protein
MIVSSDDARLLFSRWKEESAGVRIRLLSSALIFDGAGVVAEFSPETLGFNGPSWQLTVPLSDAEFSFSDPREIPLASVREAESARYEFGVAIKLSTGDQLTILEMKAVPEEDEG